MIKIMFVCHGNICRSPMAEFVMKDLVHKAGFEDAVVIESAALHTDEIGSDTHYGTKEILDRYQIPYEPRQARLAKRSDYEAFDYLIGMDKFNRRDMLYLFNNDPKDKTSLLMDWTGNPHDVADPWYTGNFEVTYDDVSAGCIALLEHVKRSVHRSQH